MSNLAKLGVVLGGYVAALFLACAALYFWTLLNPSPGSQGMQAFGGAVLFLGLFCVMSLVPTGLGALFSASVPEILDGPFNRSIRVRRYRPVRGNDTVASSVGLDDC